MKKLFLLGLFAIFTLTFATSCTEEEPEIPVVEASDKDEEPDK